MLTAPAAAPIQRLIPATDASQSGIAAGNPAPNAGSAEDFAALLARGSAPAPAVEALPPGTARAAPAAFMAANDGAAPATGQPGEPATGNRLPDMRQASAPVFAAAADRATAFGTMPGLEAAPTPAPTPAPTSWHAATSPVMAALVARRGAKPDAASPASPESAVEPDAEPQKAEPSSDASGNPVPSPSLLLAPSLVPLLPAATEVRLKPGTASRPAAADPDPTKRGAVPAAIGPAAPSPLPATPPAVAPGNAAPAFQIVLERDGPATVLPASPASEALAADPAAELAATGAQPNPAPASARAEPSTFAALAATGKPERTPVRKARSETDAPVATASAGPAEIATPALVPGQTGHAGLAPAHAASGAPAGSPPAERIGFDALVDSIARAREGAAATAPVAVALNHAEFGRVSLRFHADADGLSVAMTSLDPGFAPAAVAAAAFAAAAAPAAGSSSDHSPRIPQSSGSASSGSDPALNGQMQGGQMQNSNRDSAGQRQEAPPPSRTARDMARPAGSRSAHEPPGNGRSGIFA